MTWYFHGSPCLEIVETSYSDICRRPCDISRKRLENQTAVVPKETFSFIHSTLIKFPCMNCWFFCLHKILNQTELKGKKVIFAYCFLIESTKTMKKMYKRGSWMKEIEMWKKPTRICIKNLCLIICSYCVTSF